MGDLILRELTDALDRREAVAVATVVDTHRSVPRHAGTKMLVYRDGTTSGTIGGGEMEARVVEEALGALADHRPRLLSYSLIDPAGGDPGVCGGQVQLFVEPHLPRPELFVVGCGHIGRAVIELAHWVGFRVVATDDRPALVDEVEHADAVVAGSITEAIAAHPITQDTSVVVVTRNAPIDIENLPYLLGTPAAYIGVMGSARRWELTRSALLDSGVEQGDVDRIQAPIGLDIHAETPEEIAVSILAEVVKSRRG